MHGLNTYTTLENPPSAVYPPCAERKMDPGICQSGLQTSRPTSSTSPVRRGLHVYLHPTSSRTKEALGTYRVRHGDSGVGHEFHFPFTGQVHIHNPVAVEADLQLLVRPQVMVLSVFIRLANNTCRTTPSTAGMPNRPTCKGLCHLW